MAFLKFLRFRMRRKRVAAVADDGCSSSSSSSSSTDGAVVLGKFTWEDMKRVTKNFSKPIGLGGFSTVYLAEFPDSTRGAVKIVHGSSCSERLHRIYKQELEIFLRIRHPNIVNLLGYCDDDRQDGSVLVFYYIPNGNLHEKLHGDNGSVLLSWRSRVLIAFQVAQALDYLHDKSGLHIIHGDIKASNILLDEKLNCKLCDFGSAKMGFVSTVLPPSCSRMERTIMGSQGYMDPHYLKTGIVSKKNDIYSFGIVLLELVTGVDALRLAGGKTFKSIANGCSMVLDGVKVAKMVDPRLKNERGFDMEEAKAMVSLSAMCISHTPMLRPCASQILTSMSEKFSSISLQHS